MDALLYERFERHQMDAGGSGNSRLMNDFIVMKEFGKGRFGDVFLTRNKLDEGNYAIKRIPLYAQSEELNNRITREAKLFSKLNHPNVIRYYSAWTENAEKKESDAVKRKESSPRTKEKSMGLIGDSLLPTRLRNLENGNNLQPGNDTTEWSSSYLENGNSEPSSDDEDLKKVETIFDRGDTDDDDFICFEGSAQEFSREAEKSKDVASSPKLGGLKSGTSQETPLTVTTSKISSTRLLYIQMEFCGRGTLRSLIDAEGLMNILIDEKNCIKVGDFSFATRDFFRKMDSTSALLEVNSKVSKQTKGIETELYMAPELFDTKDSDPYSSKIDVYSTGVVLFEMFYRPLPDGMERNSTLKGLKISIAFPSDFGQEYPQNQQSLAKKFVTMMLQEKAENRPIVDQLLEDERIDVDGERSEAEEVEELEGGKANTSVLILGGYPDLNTIYLLDSKAQSWKELSITLPMGMYDFGAVVLNEEIYIFGGVAKDYQQDCYKLKDDGSWIKLASLNQGRSNISSSSLVYKGDIWVIGGYSGGPLKSVEKYDISQDKWTYMPELNIGRSNAAAAVFKDRILVTGGWNEGYLKSVEMFDPKLQKWILFCDLPIEVFGHTMLINNSILSIFGGSIGYGTFNSVWEMDIEDPEKKWTEKQSLKHRRSFFGIGKLSNGIFVFGSWGKNGETSEIFYGNEWIDGPELLQKLSFFAYTPIPRSLEERLLEQFS